MEESSSFLCQLNIAPPLPDDSSRFAIIVIGAGAIVNLGHLPAYKFAGFTVKGIYDIDNKKAQQTANKWNIPNVFDTLADAIAFTSEEQVIFDLATPASQIAKILEQLSKHSHALIQKPMGECLSEARTIVNICEERNIHGSVNLQLRYAPFIIPLKDAIRRGWLGDRITTIEIHVNVHTPWANWPFLASCERLELIYHSIHYVDVIRDLLSPHEPTALHCRTSRHAAMPELPAVRSCISFEFEHDPLLYVNIYTNHHHRWGQNHAQSYLLVEGIGGAAKAQLGGNLSYGKVPEGAQTDYLQICSDEFTQGKWIDIDLQGRSNMPHAFIGTMAAVMRQCENESEHPSTSVQNTLKTMTIIETAWESSNKTMTPIKYN